ncbi:hypothetical protein FACS1894211_02180 [Clostridia bacterium]|nr:hypothetical protein FACS1894211_02180 [Clostridia bacterium]
MLLTSETITIDICERTGRILSLRDGRTEFIAENAYPLLSVQLMRDDGSRLLIASDRAVCSLRRTKNTIKADFKRLGGQAVDATVKFDARGGFIRISAAVRNRTGFAVEWLAWPATVFENRLAARGGDFKILSPIFEGAEIGNPMLREKVGLPYLQVDYPMRGWDGLYPASTAFQFTAYYNDKCGVYFGAHDPNMNMKTIDTREAPEGVKIEHLFLPGAADNAEIASYEIVLGTFAGGWYTAAEIYRAFAERCGLIKMPPVRENPLIPDWVHESPVVLIYPVRGAKDTGAGANEPNPEYFPYTNALPYIESLAKKLDSKILVLLCHWEGTAPWAPPFVWPPYGGKENFTEFCAALHKAGHLLGVYGSGSGWTQKSILDPAYNMERYFEEHRLKDAMCIHPDQSLPYAYICNGNIRWGYDMCTYTRPAREIVKGEIERLVAESEVDYIQYFDQNLGGMPSICYGMSHGHPRTPGKWQIEAQRTLLQECNEVIERAGKKGKVVLGCEGGASEPFIGELVFNDGRNYGAYQFGVPAAAYAYLFHHYQSNFMGNQNTTYGYLDVGRYPENIFWRTASGFANGDLMTVVWRERGRLHWDWSSPWDLPQVDQEGYAAFVKLLNDWRKGAAREELLYGKMTRPYRTDCEQIEVEYKSGVVNKIPSLNTSAWRSGGWYSQLIVNWRDTEQKTRVHAGGVRAFRVYTDPKSAKYTVVAVENGVCVLTVSARGVLKLTPVKS